MRIGLASLVLLLPSLAAFGAENPFAGDWDITPEAPGRPRAWWLRVEGAGTARLAGLFNTAYGGRLNPIDEIAIHGGELHFAILAKRDNGSSVRFEYSARIVDGKLRGQFRAPGRAPIPWTGVRAPVLKDADDGSWRRRRPISLFNGKDLSGWRPAVPGSTCCWIARDGLLATAGRGSDLVSEAKFWNFELRLQYRLAANSNSGVGLRGRYEVQIKDDAGVPAAVNCSGAVYSRIAPDRNAGRSAGEWQNLQVRLVGRQVTVTLNGATVIRKREIEGLTAIAVDADEGQPGPIVLQGDHGAVEFRNVTVTPLVQARKGKTL